MHDPLTDLLHTGATLAATSDRIADALDELMARNSAYTDADSATRRAAEQAIAALGERIERELQSLQLASADYDRAYRRYWLATPPGQLASRGLPAPRELTPPPSVDALTTDWPDALEQPRCHAA